jgi:hypothetical protein
VNRVDEIFADPTRARELKKLHKLLVEYEEINKP